MKLYNELEPGMVVAAALHLDSWGEHAPMGQGVADTVTIGIDPGWVAGKSLSGMSSPDGLRELAAHLLVLADRLEES